MLYKTQAHYWLEEMYVRQALDEKEQQDLKYRESGFQGEVELASILQKEIPQDWLLLKDLRYRTRGGEIQIDILLVKPSGVTILEVKNYTAEYIYSQGLWQVNGRPKYHDDFRQLERTHQLLAQLMREQGFKIPMSSYVVFISEEDTVDIDDASLPFIKRARLRSFIRKLQEESRKYPQETWQKEVEWLLKNSEEDDHLMSLTAERYAVVQKGIYCPECKSFNTNFYHKHFKCENCYYSEAFSRTVLRMACAFGILFPYEPLRVLRIKSLVDDRIKYNTILNIVTSNFQKHSASNSYVNTHKSFDYLFKDKAFKYKIRQ